MLPAIGLGTRTQPEISSTSPARRAEGRRGDPDQRPGDDLRCRLRRRRHGRELQAVATLLRIPPGKLDARLDAGHRIVDVLPTELLQLAQIFEVAAEQLIFAATERGKRSSRTRARWQEHVVTRAERNAVELR